MNCLTRVLRKTNALDPKFKSASVLCQTKKCVNPSLPSIKLIPIRKQCLESNRKTEQKSDLLSFLHGSGSECFDHDLDCLIKACYQTFDGYSCPVFRKKSRSLRIIYDFILRGDIWEKNPQILPAVYFMALSNISKSSIDVMHYNIASYDPQLLSDKLWEHNQMCFRIIEVFLSKKSDFDLVQSSHIKRIIDLMVHPDPNFRNACANIVSQYVFSNIEESKHILSSFQVLLFQAIDSSIASFAVGPILNVICQRYIQFFRSCPELMNSIFRESIIPLVFVDDPSSFSQQMIRFLTTVFGNEKPLLLLFLDKIIRNWPSRSSQKELFFISIIEEILKFVNRDEIKGSIQRLASVLVSSVSSYSSSVAQAALSLLSKESTLECIFGAKKSNLSTLFHALICSQHWSEDVSSQIRFLLSKFNEDQIESFKSQCQNFENERNGKSLIRDTNWKIIRDMASKSN